MRPSRVINSQPGCESFFSSAALFPKTALVLLYAVTRLWCRVAVITVSRFVAFDTVTRYPESYRLMRALSILKRRAKIHLQMRRYTLVSIL